MLEREVGVCVCGTTNAKEVEVHFFSQSHLDALMNVGDGGRICERDTFVSEIVIELLNCH